LLISLAPVVHLAKPWELSLLEISPVGARFLEKEWPFLCGCASPVASQQQISTFLDDGLDWNLLLELAREHSVQGLLFRHLSQTEFTGVPAQVREELHARMRAQLLFTLSMTAELFRILADLAEENLEVVLVKGPVTSLLAYDDPGIRGYSDLDLFVRGRDIGRITQRMRTLGFAPKVPETVIRAGKIPGEYVFRCSGKPCIVEFHTERSFRHYPKRLSIEELFARKRRVLLEGREIPALRLEDELVLNCIHGAKDFWEQLMWVADVAAIVTRHPEIDWKLTREAAAEVGANRMLRVGIQLSALSFGTPLPAALAEEISRDSESQRLCLLIQSWLPYAGRQPVSIPARAWYRLQMGGGGLIGAKYLMRLSTAPAEQDWKEGAEAESSWLWDALRRPFRLMRKYGQHQ
jgi:hypothetical protein